MAVLDIDLRQLSSEQLEQLISTPVPVGFAYSVPMQLNRYSVKFTLSTSLRGNDLESVFSEHLARTGIEFQIDRAAGNEYGTRAAYHASGFAGAVKERIALWDNENLWIRHALFIRLAEEGGNQIMFFDLTDLGCRRGPRTALPSALTFDDDCVRANVTPANLGAVFADSLKDGLGATSLVLQR